MLRSWSAALPLSPVPSGRGRRSCRRPRADRNGDPTKISCARPRARRIPQHQETFPRALLAVGTWAYFSAVGRADNVITMGSVKLALHDEDGTGQPFTTVSAMPGSVVDKVVYVENVGSGAFYTRVKITPEVVAANGELVPLTDRSLLTLDLNDTDWIPGTDGYYYYNGTLSPKAATSKLFNHVTFSKDMGNEYQNTTVHIYVTAEAVQTANLDKYGPIDVWKHVGTVEASTSSTQIDPIPTA